MNIQILEQQKKVLQLASRDEKKIEREIQRKADIEIGKLKEKILQLQSKIAKLEGQLKL